MTISKDKTYLVFNYSASKVSLFVRDGQPSYLFDSGTKDEPCAIPLTIDEIISANANGGAFRNGLLFFEPEHEDAIYQTLRIKDYKNILKDWEIEDIILHPTSDGLKLLLGVTNDAYFNRIIGCYTVLKNAFADIPAQSKYILDARIDEYRSGKRATEIVVKEIVSSESQIEKLTAQLDEQKNITENLARENEKLKAELAQLNAKTKRTQKASAESGE